MGKKKRSNRITFLPSTTKYSEEKIKKIRFVRENAP